MDHVLKSAYIMKTVQLILYQITDTGFLYSLLWKSLL